MPLYSCTFCCKRWVYSTPLNGRQRKAEIGYESEDAVVFELDINDYGTIQNLYCNLRICEKMII